MRGPVPGARVVRPAAAAAVVALALLAGGCSRDTTESELRDIEKAYHSLRDAILQGDDEAFFAMHSRAAREDAVGQFPLHRSQYVALPPEGKRAFLARFHLTEEEFLKSEPRALVVKMLPWESGWRERREMFRSAKVKDVRIERVAAGAAAPERRGVVVLDISGMPGLPPGTAIPETHLPTVILVKDPDGWRRRSFFME